MGSLLCRVENGEGTTGEEAAGAKKKGKMILGTGAAGCPYEKGQFYCCPFDRLLGFRTGCPVARGFSGRQTGADVVTRRRSVSAGTHGSARHRVTPTGDGHP